MPAPPFGLWDSPIQAQDLAHSKGLKDVAWDADGHTRGYAVPDLNERGSTGYGRDDQKALRRHWGIYDYVLFG